MPKSSGLALGDVIYLMNASDSSSSSFSSSRQRAKQHELIRPWEKKKVGGGHLSFLSSLLTNEMGLRPFLFLFF